MPAQKRRRFLIRQKQKRRAKRKEVWHSVSYNPKFDAFFTLQNMLKKGFRGKKFPNAHLKEKIAPNLWLATWSAPSNLPETHGDLYAIEMLTKAKNWNEDTGHFMVEVKHAHPEQIKKIYIFMNRKVSGDEKAKRIEFYKKEFPKVLLEFV